MKDWKAFRTPTLREISKTGPYMHNGVFSTEEVKRF
jgi:cytochrome c peroxidase